MRRLQRFSLLAVLLIVPAFASCGGGGGNNDMGPIQEPLDQGTNDMCTNSQVTCSGEVSLAYQYCLSEDETTCYVRRMGMQYACDECGVAQGCVLAVEELVAAQCP